MRISDTSFTLHLILALQVLGNQVDLAHLSQLLCIPQDRTSSKRHFKTSKPMRTLSDAPDRQNEHDPLHARRCLDLKARCLSLSLSIDVLLRYGGLWRMIVVLHLSCRSRVIPQDSSGQRGGSREQLTSDWRTKKRDPSFRLLLLRSRCIYVDALDT